MPIITKATPYVCGILPLGEENSRTVLYFHKVLSTLIKDYNIGEVLFPFENCTGGYFRILTALAVAHSQIEFRLVTHYPRSLTHQGPDGPFAPISCLYAIENLPTRAKHLHTRNISVHKHIIDHADFCICNCQSTNFLSPAVRRHLTANYQLEVFDLAQLVKE